MKLNEQMAWRKKRTDILMKTGRDIGPWQNQKTQQNTKTKTKNK